VPLALIEKTLSSEYESETEFNTGSVLLAQLSQPTPLPEAKRSSTRRKNLVDFVICIRRVSRHLEGNVLEDLEGEILEYKIVGKFFVDIRKEFKGGDKKAVKVAELKRLE